MIIYLSNMDSGQLCENLIFAWAASPVDIYALQFNLIINFRFYIRTSWTTVIYSVMYTAIDIILYQIMVALWHMNLSTYYFVSKFQSVDLGW